MIHNWKAPPLKKKTQPFNNSQIFTVIKWISIPCNTYKGIQTRKVPPLKDEIQSLNNGQIFPVNKIKIKEMMKEEFEIHR